MVPTQPTTAVRTLPPMIISQDGRPAMKPYAQQSTRELEAAYQGLMEEYRSWQQRGLQLDMSRGKPDAHQLSFADAMLDTVTSASGARSQSGVDCRNYGCPDGLPEVRQMMADMLEVAPDEIILGGNSSLNMMFDAISRAMTQGVYGSDKPWCREPELKFLCPAPGYDRHFAITQHFGIQMIPVEMTPQGPNMDQVEEYVRDPAVKGIWCVPKYSNPTGAVYSPETVDRLARLRPGARDFRIFWDNAYCVHNIYEEDVPLANLFARLKEQGSGDMIFLFGSTSKISYAGGGVAAIAGSRNNMQLIRQQMAIQTIGYDKISQLMHARFFRDLDGIKEHMKLHAAAIRPKFQLVDRILTQELEGLDIARWTKPKGGYFISFDALDQCAQRIVALCKEAGVVTTPAGATYPYGVDPNDRNIRIAPTFPSMEELEEATRLFCLCTKLASVEYYLTISR